MFTNLGKVSFPGACGEPAGPPQSRPPRAKPHTVQVRKGVDRPAVQTAGPHHPGACAPDGDAGARCSRPRPCSSLVLQTPQCRGPRLPAMSTTAACPAD